MFLTRLPVPLPGPELCQNICAPLTAEQDTICSSEPNVHQTVWQSKRGLFHLKALLKL